MEDNKDSLISSLLARLEKLEAEVSQLKQLLAPAKTDLQIKQQKSLEMPQPEKSKEQIRVPKTSSPSLENAIGTKWIGRIGMLAIIFGVGFFLKYSFDNRLIGETGRILLGIIFGTCFIGAGEYFQKKKNLRIYGQVLTGGGIAILYFSIYAAFAFYHLISQTFAFMGLAAITTTGITLSIRYSAVSISVIGILGGFLTPIMLSTGENKPIALFSYILLLNLGIIFVAYFKQWRSLVITSLIATIIIYMGWHSKFYTVDQHTTAFIVTTVFFIVFSIYALFTKASKEISFAEQGIIIINTAFYLLSYNAQNNYVNDWSLKSFVLVLSSANLLFAILTQKIKPYKNYITYCFTGISVLLNIIAVFVIFEKEWLSAAIAAEMVIFCYIGIRLNKLALRLVSYMLGLIAFARFFEDLIIHLGPFERFTLILNSRFAVCLFIIVAFYAMLGILSKNKVRLGRNESFLVPANLVITQLFSVILLSVEFYNFYDFSSKDKSLSFAELKYAKQLALSVIWAVYASGLVSAGLVKRIKLLRMLGILLLGITVLKVFLLDLSELRTIYRILSFVTLGLLLLAVSYFYNRFKHRIFGDDKNE